MSETNFGINATVTVFKQQVEIESKSENLKRFEFNKGKAVTFDKKDVLEGFKAHEIKLSEKVIKAIPEKTQLVNLLYDAKNGEVNVAIKMEFNEDFITNKYDKILSLDSISLSLRRTPDDDIEGVVTDTSEPV